MTATSKTAATSGFYLRVDDQLHFCSLIYTPKDGFLAFGV